MGKEIESFQSIFGDDCQDKDGIIKLKIEQLISFEKHPFKLYEGKRLEEMIESIKNFGVIVPIVVRQKGLKYEILSGHNRTNASKLAGLNEVPAIIKEDLTEEEATLIVTETNLMQRSFADLVHSERAAVIATRHEAMKRQGLRTDLLEQIEKLSSGTSYPVDKKLSAHKEIGKEYNLSQASIARYLRINKLSDNLKELIDEEKIAIRVGVDLSYLKLVNQEIIEKILSENRSLKINIKKAKLLREYDKDDNLDFKIVMAIIVGKINKKEERDISIKIKPNIFSKYFRIEQKQDEIEKIIDIALANYYEIYKSDENIDNKRDVNEVEEKIKNEDIDEDSLFSRINTSFPG